MRAGNPALPGWKTWAAWLRDACAASSTPGSRPPFRPPAWWCGTTSTPPRPSAPALTQSVAQPDLSSREWGLTEIRDERHLARTNYSEDRSMK